MKILTAMIILTCCLECSSALSCALICNQDTCRPRNCRGGYVKDMCGCCDTCAKLENEHCGGIYGANGRCDAGLRCERSESPPMSTGTCVPNVTDTEVVAVRIERGIKPFSMQRRTISKLQKLSKSTLEFKRKLLFKKLLQKFKYKCNQKKTKKQISNPLQVNTSLKHVPILLDASEDVHQ